MLRIALAQINPTVGDLKGNAAKIIAFIKKAKKQKADVVIFPELALTGYPPEDLLLKPHFIAKNRACLKTIKRFCHGITVLVGFVDSKDGLVYNACAVIQEGEVQDVYRKIILPNYSVFDEKRYFSSGHSLSLYTLGSYKLAITICEDIWEEEIIEALKGKGIDFIVNISASPFHLQKIAEREKMLAQAARLTGCFVFYCNLVGGQDELVFDGTSKVLSPGGALIACAGRFVEDMLLFRFQRKVLGSTKKIHYKPQEEAYAALLLGLGDYVRKNGFKKVIVGVSGGIDSAVTLSLAQKALGRNNVFALLMPSSYTSRATLADAQAICKNLGVQYKCISIDPILKEFCKALKSSFGKSGGGTMKENLQARIRGNILMAFSNAFGYLVLNTGNKSEVSCGYCTLYGDMVGGFGVLKDVPKLLVYRIARYINAISSKPVIPASVMRRAPSAELKPNQKDSDTLPVYKVLDPILKLYVEKDLSCDQIVKKGYKRKVVKQVITMVDHNEYKRRQAPVGIKITPRAFGKDRRMPITNRFSE